MERFSAMYAVKLRANGYQELLEAAKPDMAIVYPQDASAQFEMTKAALLSGADVLCERPVCHSVAEGEELVELQKETGHFVMPRYNRRYMPAYTSAERILRSAGFGKARMYHSSFHAAPYASEAEFVANTPVSRLPESGAVDFLAPGGASILNENFAQLNNNVFYGF
jgi:predicted dehydrogenase